MENYQVSASSEADESRRLILFSSVILGANVAFFPLFVLNTALPIWCSVALWLLTTLVTTETLWEFDEIFLSYPPQGVLVRYLIIVYNLLHVGLSLAVLWGGQSTVYTEQRLSFVGSFRGQVAAIYVYIWIFYFMSLLHFGLSFYYRQIAEARKNEADKTLFASDMVCDGFALVLDIILLFIIVTADTNLAISTILLFVFTIIEYRLYPFVGNLFVRES